jgi:hypothetical protein
VIVNEAEKKPTGQGGRSCKKERLHALQVRSSASFHLFTGGKPPVKSRRAHFHFLKTLPFACFAWVSLLYFDFQTLAKIV